MSTIDKYNNKKKGIRVIYGASVKGENGSCGLFLIVNFP